MVFWVRALNKIALSTGAWREIWRVLSNPNEMRANGYIHLGPGGLGDPGAPPPPAQIKRSGSASQLWP